MSHLHKRRAGCLCENRRCFASVAEVDSAGVHGFQKLRTSRKFRPRRFITKGLQLFIERAPAFEQDQLSVFLESDAKNFVLCPCGSSREK
jgi:hypothetical protein